MNYNIYISPKTYSSKFSEGLFEFKRENFNLLDLGTAEIEAIKRRKIEELKSLERELIEIEVEQKKLNTKQVVAPKVEIQPSSYRVEYKVINGSEVDKNRSSNLINDGTGYRSTTSFNVYDQSPQMGPGGYNYSGARGQDKSSKRNNVPKNPYDIHEKNRKAMERMRKKRAQNDSEMENLKPNNNIVMEEEERRRLILI